jgi:VPDSG-CTERM motif
MKTLKYATLIAVLCFGLTSVASATLTLFGPFNKDNGGPANQGPATVLAFFQDFTGETDAFNCIDRINQQPEGGTVTSGDFTFVFTPSDTPGGQTVTVTFDLTGTGTVLCGFWVFGGNRGGNLYTVSADEGTTGTFTLNAPLAGKSGNFATISHIDVFCCPGVVPDSGTTAMLLGGALAGLALGRRYLKRR